MKDLAEGMITIKARMDLYHLAFGQKSELGMIIIIIKAQMEFCHLAILAIGLKLERAMLYPLMIGLKIGIIQHLVIHKKIRLHFQIILENP